MSLKLELNGLQCPHKNKHVVGRFHMHVVGVDLDFFLYGFDELTFKQVLCLCAAPLQFQFELHVRIYFIT